MKNSDSFSQFKTPISIENDLILSNEAIEKGNPETIDINAKDNDGWTRLHKAVDTKSLEDIKAIIKAGADVDVKDNDGWTPLHLAAMKNDIKIAEILLTEGANIDIRNKAKYLPWHIAILKGNLKLTRKLIQLKIDNKLEYEEDTASIRMMIKSNYLTKDHYNIIKQLILSGVDMTRYLPIKNEHMNNLISGICEDIGAIVQNDKIEFLVGKYTDVEDIEFAVQLFINFYKFGIIDYSSYDDVKQKIIRSELLQNSQHILLKNTLLKKIEHEQKAGIEFMAIVEGEMQHYLYGAESPVSKYLIQINAIKNNKSLLQENKEKVLSIIYKNLENSLIKLLETKEHNLNYTAISIIESEINNKQAKNNLQKSNIVKNFKNNILNLKKYLLPSKNILDALNNLIKKYYEYSENELIEYSIKLQKDVISAEEKNQELIHQVEKNIEQTNKLNNLINSWNLTDKQKDEWQKFLAESSSSGEGFIVNLIDMGGHINTTNSDHLDNIIV